MKMLQVVLWMIYPYTVVTILGMGLVWQYDITKVLENTEVELKTGNLLKRTVTSLMSLSIITGVAVLTSMTNEPKQLLDWVVSLLKLHPDLKLIINISILSQVHLLLVLTLLLVLSFTKYISYVFIPHRYVKVHLVKKITKL